MYQPPKFSRGPGKVNEEDYRRLLILTESDPREAMLFAEQLFGCGDGSNYAAIAGNMAAVVAYGRRLQASEDERNFVFDLPLWEGYPPTGCDWLFVAFRLRYSAGRTKTAAYERARVHFSAIHSAYRNGIRPDQIRGYIEEHGIEKLYSWSQRPADTIGHGDELGSPEHPTGKQVPLI